MKRYKTWDFIAILEKRNSFTQYFPLSLPFIAINTKWLCVDEMYYIDGIASITLRKFSGSGDRITLTVSKPES